jgi:NAD(P)-dependent dehydrogenase (short-subunit alcohol dehydrogenase family)
VTSVAFVTGAAGGIGQAIHASLARSGFTVYGGDLSVDTERADGAAVLAPLDVRSAESVDKAVAAAASLGSVIAVVNCAGIVRSTPLDAMSDEDVLAVWNVNVAGAARVCRAGRPLSTSARSRRDQAGCAAPRPMGRRRPASRD